MTKGELIREFLAKGNYADKKIAYAAFTRQHKKVVVSKARFDFVFKEITESNGTICPDVDILEDEDVVITQINKLHFPDSILIPFKSETPLDTLMSEIGGTLPATITMAPGTSGVGKSTVLLHYLGKIKKQHPKTRVLFVSAEMNQIHLFKYSKRINFDNVEILLLGEYKNTTRTLEKIFNEGWDIILLDSFQHTIDLIVGNGLMKSTRAEAWLLDLMDKTRLASNKLSKYTSFIATEHMTKGGDFAGSTKRKHMTDAMSNFLFDESGDPYIEFVKNRDGEVRRKLYFKIDKEQGVIFNTERFIKDTETRNEVSKVKELTEKKNEQFDSFFNPTPVKEEVNF